MGGTLRRGLYELYRTIRGYIGSRVSKIRGKFWGVPIVWTIYFVLYIADLQFLVTTILICPTFGLCFDAKLDIAFRQLDAAICRSANSRDVDPQPCHYTLVTVKQILGLRVQDSAISSTLGVPFSMRPCRIRHMLIRTVERRHGPFHRKSSTPRVTYIYRTGGLNMRVHGPKYSGVRYHVP